MNLVATCPSCATVFTMAAEQLEASDGQVRCGHCMEVFNAKAQLAAQDDLSHPQTSHEFIEHDAVLGEAIDSADLSFIHEAHKKLFWTHPFTRILLLIFSLILFAMLASQVVRTERERVNAWFPSLAPWTKIFCTQWLCQSQARRQIDGWLIENSSFLKEGSDSFRLTTQIKNITASALIVPQFELQLTDSNDALLIRSIVKPEGNSPTSLAAGEEKTFHWLITSKLGAHNRMDTKSITGYRLTVFYP